MSRILETISTIGALVMAATPLAAVGGMAHAQAAGVPAQRIDVARLDFRNAGDVVAFRQRVGAAAQTLCGQGGVQPLSVTLSCRQAVYDEAVSQLGGSQRQDLQASTRGAGFTVAAR